MQFNSMLRTEPIQCVGIHCYKPFSFRSQRKNITIKGEADTLKIVYIMQDV